MLVFVSQLMYRILSERILLLCSTQCPNWWFSLTQPPNAQHLLTLGDCLGLSNTLLTKICTIIKCNKKQHLTICLAQHGLKIPHVHVYSSHNPKSKHGFVLGQKSQRVRHQIK